MIIPRKGDEWEFKLPGKQKRRKVIGYVSFVWHQGDWDADKCEYKQWRYPRAHWERQNKGRYTSIRIKALLKHGRRISTQAEREAHWEAMIGNARARRGKK